MIDLAAQIRLLMRIFAFWLAFCLLMWAAFPSAQPIYAGLILGSLTSFLNAIHLARKVQQISDKVAGEYAGRATIGFISRICFVLIAIMVASRLPQFDEMATVIGIMLAPLAALVANIVIAIRNNKS